MANPMFERQSSGPVKNGGIFGSLFNRAYANNPVFRDFANGMRGMSTEEMCSKCGVSTAELQEAMKDPAGFLARKGLL